ncbi:HNH endonuclease [Shewanella frigidimarina]|uniref:HNH endonuclease n=1 Tax=Shewanella frigidimarina TaxID=56812 RepID=UPI003D7BC770
MELRRCFRKPIPEIYDIAKYMDAAVSAHNSGHFKVAEELFNIANNLEVREWTESIWGKKSPYVNVQRNPSLHCNPKAKNRMPNMLMKKQLRARDGFHCRFCGIPVIRSEIRAYFHKIYPDAVPWGKTNITQHAGFQCLWLQYDHVTPHSAGGENALENLIITCGPCNFGKVNYSLGELRLIDPRDFHPIISSWDGLERALKA